MTTFSHRARMYEVQQFGPVDEPGFHYECWDVTDGSGGYLGRIVVPSIDGAEDVVVELERPVAAPVLKRWMQKVPELADATQ